MNIKIGEALRLIRVFHDKKANKRAECLKISKSYLSEIENDKKQPSLELIQKYSEYFQVTASAILLFAENIVTTKGKMKKQLGNKIFQFLQTIEATGEQK